MSKEFQGKTVLVTGASRGMGRAVAERLGAGGATVAVHYGRSQAQAGEVVDAIRANGGDAFAIQADVSEPAVAQRIWDQADREFTARTGSKSVDILVNNAGIAPFVGFADTTIETLDEIYAVNVRAPFLITQAAVSRLNDGGRVINFSSVVKRLPFPAVAAYSALKAPIDNLTQTLAVELGPRGITVNAVAPGAIATDMAEFLNDEEGRNFAMSKQALKRVGAAADVADVVAFLASDAARWISGQTIEVSGGTSLTFGSA